MDLRKKQVYEMMTAIINANQFKFDHEKEKISLKLPYTEDMIKDFRRIVLTLFGNPHIAYHEFGDDPRHAEYKFDSHFIEIDEQTIKVNKYGRLCVNWDDVKYGIEQAILKDEEFLDRLLRAALKRWDKPKMLNLPPVKKPGKMPIHFHHTPGKPWFSEWPKKPIKEEEPPIEEEFEDEEEEEIIIPNPGGTLPIEEDDDEKEHEPISPPNPPIIPPFGP